MNKPAYEHFAFQVGGFVQSVLLTDCRMGRKRMQVIERTYQECPGGIQLHYVCRCQLPFGQLDADLRKYNEIELQDYDPKTDE